MSLLINNRHRLWLTVVSTAILVACFSIYTFSTSREQSGLMVMLFASAFACYLYATIIDQERDRYWWWIGIGLRLILFLSLPILSDDYFRFIWDGRLLNAGINPFESLPADQLSKGIPGIDQTLFEQLNSTAYFTIYPPLNQFIFWLSAWLFPNSLMGSVTVIRGFVFLADIGNFLLLRKLAKVYQLKSRVALLYFLNPLVILEFTGNLHFESVMIFFILLAVYLLERKQSNAAAVSIGLGIISKLLPLMYMPAMMKYLRLNKLIIFYLITGVVVIISFIPLLSMDFLEGMSSSIDLYFRKFEFNASIYFVARAVGYAFTGFNAIAYIGPLMGLLTISSMVGYLLINRKKPVTIAETLLFTHFFYLLFATTVHPWYITTLLALTVLTRYRFAMVWSGMAFLTYLGYHADGFSLPNWVLYVEYLSVFAYLMYEILRNNQQDVPTLSAKST